MDMEAEQPDKMQVVQVMVPLQAGIKIAVEQVAKTGVLVKVPMPILMSLLVGSAAAAGGGTEELADSPIRQVPVVLPTPAVMGLTPPPIHQLQRAAEPETGKLKFHTDFS